MNPVNIIYIASAQYSGSTLLAYLLAQSDEVVSIGERSHFYKNAIANRVKPGSFKGTGYLQGCTCTKSFDDCEYWGGAAKKLEAEFPFDMSTDRVSLRHDKNWVNRAALLLAKRVPPNAGINAWVNQAYGTRLRYNLGLIRHLLQMSGANVFVDSSKNSLDFYLLSTSVEVNIKVIHLYRKPEFWIDSYLKRSSRKNVTVPQAYERWERINSDISQLAEKQRIPNYPLSYEDLCLAPEKELSKLGGFLGFEPSTKVTKPLDQLHLMGNGSFRKTVFTGVRPPTDQFKVITQEEVAQIRTRPAPQFTQNLHIS